MSGERCWKSIGNVGDLGGVLLRGRGRITSMHDGIGLGLFMVIVLDGEGVRAWWLGLFIMES
jgi:hypothetical protein